MDYKHHNDTFATWLQKEVMANDEIHEQLAWLAKGLANSSLMYQGYEINGYTFIQDPEIIRAPIKIVVFV